MPSSARSGRIGEQAVVEVTLQDGSKALAPVFVQTDTGGSPITPYAPGTGASADQVQGNVAAGSTDVGNPLKMGGVFQNTLPTLADGQRGNLMLDQNSQVRVTLSTNYSTLNGASDNISTGNSGLAVVNFGLIYDSANTKWVRQAGNVNGAYCQGNVASAATDSGNPVKIGGKYNSSLPTFTDGQRTDVQTDANGNLRSRMVGYWSAGADAQANTLSWVTEQGATGNPHPLATALFKYNGNTYDRDRKPNVYSRLTASATGGSPTLVKSSAGDLGTFWGLNGGTATYLQIYNKASAPVIGTDTPVLTFPILANAAFSPPAGYTSSYFSTGIGYAFTTDAAGTTAAAASAVTSFVFTAA